MVKSSIKKAKGRFCCAYACTNKPVPKKGGLCHKHYARELKERDPVAVRYNQFKSSAKQRGKAFNISLVQFREFCSRTGYIVNKGYRGKVATIDRIDNRKGYEIDNIQLLSLSANASKGAKNFDEDNLPF